MRNWPKNKSKGFTLIELLVVLAILGLLAGLGLVNLRSSQRKARDVQRKNDLNQFGRAMEMYYNDKGGYLLEADFPESDDEWRDGSVTDGSLYMKMVPADPQGGDYIYDAGDCGLATCDWYKIYAVLENENDPSIEELGCAGGCGPGNNYNYYTASSNAPEEDGGPSLD